MRDLQIEILKNLSSAERLELAFDLHEFARNRISAEIFRLNPQLEKEELDKLVKKRFGYEY